MNHPCDLKHFGYQAHRILLGLAVLVMGSIRDLCFMRVGLHELGNQFLIALGFKDLIARTVLTLDFDFTNIPESEAVARTGTSPNENGILSVMAILQQFGPVSSSAMLSHVCKEESVKVRREN